MDSQSEPQDGREDDAAKLLVPSQALVRAPVGGDGTAVSAWFDAAVAAAEPLLDGTLDAEREAADAYRRMATADNTRRAYRAAVRVWCAWCARHDLRPLPAAGADVAAFLAGERGRKRIKSLCGAKPPQKLRWTNAGRWAERLALWRFYQGQSESGLIIAARPGRSAWYDSRIAVGSGVFGTIDSVIWGRVGAIGCVGDRGSRWHAEARDGKGERWRRTRTC